MSHRLGLALLLLLTTTAPAQLSIADRPIPQFEVHAEPRLTALARLGSMTKTSLLIEIGDTHFLHAPINLTLQDTSEGEVIAHVLRGPISYPLREDGRLLIISGPVPSHRVANLQLGPTSFAQNSLAAVFSTLEFSIRVATGCQPTGYFYAGPPLDLDIPPFELAGATVEEVVARIALAPEASFWVIPPEPQTSSCLSNPAAHWLLGLYGFGSGFTDCYTPFRESISEGVPQRTRYPHADDETCREPHLPTSPPIL